MKTSKEVGTIKGEAFPLDDEMGTDESTDDETWSSRILPSPVVRNTRSKSKVTEFKFAIIVNMR